MMLIELIKSDLEIRKHGTGIASFFLCYFHPMERTFRYVFWLRICHAVGKRKLLRYAIGWLCLLIRCHYEVKYGIVTPSSIDIGKGINIVHGGGVYLNARSIGDNFTVFQGVTLGKKGSLSNDGFPTIGNNVTVCTGAVVVGNVKLGDGCVVGANAFVSHDVPSNTLVGGVPAKVIKLLNQ